MKDTFVYWPIHTLNRKKANPFPLEVRIWCLQWDLVPENLKKHILEVLAPEQAKREIKEGEDEWTLTLAKPDFRMLLFRKYFVYQPNFDLDDHRERFSSELKRILPVNLHFEYFEDEDAKPLTKIDIYRFKTGEVNPVIPFEPRSVLQLGAAPVRDTARIDQSDTDTIEHFLEIVELLSASAWYRSPIALTVRPGSDSQNLEMESTFPDQNEIYQVVLGIRQLYGSDDVFNRAVNTHAKICGETKKVSWIKDIKNLFNSLLNEPGGSFMTKELSGRQFLDAFLYGARIVHSGKQEEQQRFNSLIATHGRASVIMSVHMLFRRLLDLSRMICPVIKQDYAYWISVGKCPKPSLFPIDQLLASAKENLKKD